MLRKLFFHSPVRYIAGVGLATVICFVCLFTKGFDYSISFVDAFQAAGGVLFFLGLLQCVSFYGAFEIFGYGFSCFRGKERRYKDYYEYQKAKQAERSRSELTYVPFIVVGIFYFSIGLILKFILF